MSLVQTCEVDENEASYFLTAIDDNTITKSLYNANGKCGNVGVSATNGLVTKCDFSTKGQPVPVSFQTGVNVVDIDVLCFKNDRYGIVVAANNPWTEDDKRDTEQSEDGFMTKKDKAAREETAGARPYNPVLLYVENSRCEFKLQRRIKVYGEISCMRVLINPTEMASQQPFLSHKIGSWPNLLAIGCHRSSCFLGQFTDFDPEKAEHWATDTIIEVSATTDALESLVDREGRFNFTCGNVPNSFRKDEERVTAVSYIPCYGVVVIGLSNGCCVLVPLDGKSCISCLTIPYATPINFLVVLEPEYDPQGGFFIFSARERPQVKHKNSMLIVCSHKIARQPNGEGGHEYQDMTSVMIPIPEGAYWLNVHGIVKKRRRRDAEAGNDTTGDASALPEDLNTTQHMNSDGMERTLLFYSYVSLNGEMKGGLFDLNAFYTRRCATQYVRFDDYGQNPICSKFTMSVPRRNTGDALFRTKDISWVHCQSLDRFVSPLFDRDALFQPMAAALHLVIHTFGKYAYEATVDSLQYTALYKIADSLSDSLAQPDLAISWLERTGLVLAPTTKRERLRMEERPANERVPTELDKIMRAIVSDDFIRQKLIKFIEESMDRKQQLHIGRWMFNELREIVARLDESIAPLFDSVAPEMLSKDAKELIAYCPAFFEFAELVFWKIRGRGAELANDTTRLRWVRKMHALMAFDLRLFLAAVKWFTRKLPMHEGWTRDLLDEVAELSEERSERARAQSYPLFLDALLARLHEKTMDDPLWRGIADPTQWYPPQRFNLVSLLRQGDAALADRTALVLYFLLDVDEVVKRESERPDDQKRGYPVKDSLVRSFLIWEVGKLVDMQSCDGVRERWEADMKGRPGQKENSLGQKPVVSRLTDQEKAELRNLLDNGNKFRRLQKVDEDRMKFLMNKQDYGIYRFNIYLIRKGRFPEVDDLPLPRPSSPFPHLAVKEYAKYKEMALAQKAQLPPPTYSNAFACPYVITKSAPKNSPKSPSRIVKTGHITIRGKTPKKLNIFKRATTSAAAACPAASAIQSTPPSGRAAQSAAASEAETARINALLKTPSMRFHNQPDPVDEEELEGREQDSNVAPDEMARVREALRTPRSRATAAARAAAGEGTPDDAPRTAMIPPTSILKSAHKHSRLPQSVTKSRLRFANVFEEKSISPRDRDNSASTASMSQPNFDDSFEDDEQVLSKSTASHSSNDVLATTRLEREIEEEERQSGRTGEDTDEASMESADQPSGGEEEEADGVTDEGEERIEEQEQMDPFAIYHDSEDAASTDGEEANSAFVVEEDESAADAAASAAAAAGPKTPPPTPDEEEEEEPAAPPAAATGDDVAADEREKAEEDEEENVSRAVTPVDDEEEVEKEQEQEEQVAVEDAAEQHELQPAAAADASDRPTTPTAAAAAAATTPTPRAADATFTVTRDATPTAPAASTVVTSDSVNATFVVETGPAAAAGAAGEEEEQQEHAAPAAANVLAALEEEEEEQPEAVEPAAPVAPLAAAVVEEDEKEEEAEEPNLSRASTPVDGEEEQEEEMQEAAPAAAAGDAPAADEGEKAEENVSRAETPVEEEEEKEEEEVAMEEHEEEPQEEVAEEHGEKEVEENPLEFVAPVVRPPVPPRPMPRTVYANRTEPISLGLRSYIYMEDGIEKSYEEQRDSSEDEKEEGEDADDILARLSPRRRSSSRLQKKGEEEPAATTAAAAAAAASSSRKRTSSRTRKESEKEAAGPSTSRSPKQKKERREEEEGEAEGEDGHLFTTTRTRVVEERYVERDDGVLQHTVKQSTKVVEMTDGVVVKKEREDKETIEEEGDRQEMDEADRATPPMVEAAEAPATDRKSSRAAAVSRSRTMSTGSRASTRGKKDGEEQEKREEKATTPLRSPGKTAKTARRRLMSGEEEEKEKEEQKKEEEEVKRMREEKATTPLRTPTKTAAKSARRRLMSGEEEEKEKKEDDKKPEEPLTPRRSTRVRKPSETSTASVASLTPSKSSRKAPTRAMKTPSRESSVAPPPRLVLDDKEEEEAAVKATVATPSKRGRPRKEPVADAAAAEVEVQPPLAKRRTTGIPVATAGSARKRAASESLQQRKKAQEEEEKEEGEEEEDPIAKLRRMRDEGRAEVLAIRERKRKASQAPTKKLLAIPEDTVAKIEKRGGSQKKNEEKEEDQPSTSQATAPRSAARKRTQSETAVKVEKELKTPSKKKTKAAEEDDEEGAGDQSMLRRSTRKAAVTANEVLKTPSKSSTRGKQ